MDQGSYSDEKKGKNIEGKREYGCPCGKTYLSYPALFTHVKQKHNGKAPGKLTKPKKEKPRGRPKIHVDLGDNDMSDVTFNLEEEVQKILDNVEIEYNETFEGLQGIRTCQNMATSFLSQLSEIDEVGKKVLNCFLNELKNTVDEKMGQKYWKEEKPSQIIDLANSMCKSHEENKKIFPLQRDLLIELMFLLFRWMYKNKWTDHKLVKKKADTE